MNVPEIRQKINKLLGDFTSQASEGFLSLSNELKNSNVPPEQIKNVDKLFKKLIEFNRELSSSLNSVLNDSEKSEKVITQLKEEKRRLEVLYTSGILFLSEVEMKQLMQRAIDTVIHELNADEGFIVLVDEEGTFETVVSKNMELNQDSEAHKLSKTVIENSIKQIKPLKLNDLQTEQTFAKQTSVISLGLTAVLCVPMISDSRVLGAVYLDRRKKDKPFKETDLTFLISFAKQIVKGIEISLEINALEERLETESKINFEELRKEFKSDEIVGSSKKILDVLKLASKVSGTDATILILGENGTGKDILAKAIHENSERRNKPFVAVNCGAIPSDLLESELFGYESGAFTGANKSKPGKLEMAEGGTVLLDEIAEMSVNLQAKLLRVIQTKEIERLGSVNPRKIDIRFIAATNQNIKELIASGKFREDLYYRLKVIEIKIPPLRERKEDIEQLVESFIKKYSDEEKEVTVSSEVIEILESYDWPGNVRELENVIQRSIILAKGNILQKGDLPPEIIEEESGSVSSEQGNSLLDAETEFRKLYIIKALRKTKTKAEAAKLLGINRTHLYKLLDQLDINE